MKKLVLLFLVMIATISCTEPYALQSNTFEDVLVVEATLTNELKKQEIKVTRTFRLEENEPQTETNATVYVIDDLGNQYNFNETNGKYISEFEFQAVPNRQYQLFVNTSNGKQYSSTREELTTVNNMTSIEAKVKNKFGVNGIDITANSYDPTGTSKYYRYEYEETHRFTVPQWVPDSITVYGNAEYWDLNGHITYAFNIVDRSSESKNCFKTAKSTEIILNNTTSYAEDRISDYSIRFISQEDFIIADRYSILVKQYIHNINSYSYYKVLRDISGSGSVLSPNQPGFIYGNIKNNSDSNEKVIGYFDVSSVSEKRIFFNYSDLFPNTEIPDFPYECIETVYDTTLLRGSTGFPVFGLTDFVNKIRTKKILRHQTTSQPNVSTFKSECSDCRVTGSNTIPSFWQ
ncbi:DUF4249 domain-containing protein [uncultured Flavobacterium sp.]|uniref:DUF4249 domain-containing protein n=1 Tax=uncultured Flavobacterium sp. TaxID=165435 RepID=UPI0030EF4D57